MVMLRLSFVNWVLGTFFSFHNFIFFLFTSYVRAAHWILLKKFAFFFIFNRPKGPPCTVILFTVPFYNKASCTRCLPLDSRLTRDLVQETIADEVDGVEESSLAALALVIIDTIVVIATLVALLLKRSPDPRIVSSRNTHATPRRATLGEESLSALR